MILVSLLTPDTGLSRLAIELPKRSSWRSFLRI